MSLLMQALRKAERARAQDGHEQEEEPPEVAPSAPPMEGGPAFAVMPDGWRLEPLNLESPVVPAQEAAHDPVPPQARHEFTRNADSGDGGGAAHPTSAKPEGAVRAGRHAPNQPRALASSQRRLFMLVATLAALVALFAFIYWRALSGPGPGSRLPMVPMPLPGANPAVPPNALQGSGIPVTPQASATDTALGISAAGAGAADAMGELVAASDPQQTSSAAAPATRPNADVTIPTPEQLAAIPDPAIRAEAMRDAAERAARQVRSEAALGTATNPAGLAGAASSGGPPQVAEAAPRAGVAAPATVSPVTSAASASRRRGATAAGASGTGATSGAAPLRTAVGENGDVRFVRGAAPAGIAPAVQNGYNALKAGDLAAARQQYDLALLQDPSNRDALLGAAAVALREQDGRQAASNYLRLLELNPNDPEALAGLAELRPGELETNEIKLKGLARQHPDSGPVQFALGNLHARQGRWSEAQQSYFRAFSAMPENADYAFNLGVGLDHMNQPRLAQTYYRRALELAQTSPPTFNTDAVRKRLQVLETPPR